MTPKEALYNELSNFTDTLQIIAKLLDILDTIDNATSTKLSEHIRYNVNDLNSIHDTMWNDVYNEMK